MLHNPAKDGCGPYGRHLTGAVDWQKYYALSFAFLDMANELLINGIDAAMAVPPPSEDMPFAAIRVYVPVGGTNSFIRYALYDAENMAALKLIADSGEAASDAAAFVEIAAAGVLRRNRRYLAMVCARGTVLPSVPKITTALYCNRNWLGKSVVDPRIFLGRINYTRAYGAFPATYNGVFGSVSGEPIFIEAKL